MSHLSQVDRRFVRLSSFYLCCQNYAYLKKRFCCVSGILRPVRQNAVFRYKDLRMSKTIKQKIVFRNIPAPILYNTYVDSKEHGAAIGAPVKIQSKEGAKFSAHGNYIAGRTFQLVKHKLIVQSWRTSDWKKSDTDSTLILFLSKTVQMALLIWYTPMFQDMNLMTLKKDGMIIIGNPGKNILPPGRKNNLFLFRIITIAILNY